MEWFIFLTVGIGSNAGRYATGSYNTFVGGYAGQGGTTSAPFSSSQYIPQSDIKLLKVSQQLITTLHMDIEVYTISQQVSITPQSV